MPDTLRTFLRELAAVMKRGGDAPEHWVALALRKFDSYERIAVRDCLASILSNKRDHDDIRRTFNDALHREHLIADGNMLQFLASLARHID